MKVGRNDPCPCGSGNKYKKCCLSEAAPPPAADAREAPSEAVRTRDAAIAALARFAGRPEFDEFRAEAERVFSGQRALAPSRAELDDDVGVKFAFFFLFDFPISGRRTIAQDFLERQGQDLPAWQQRLLHRFSRARLRLYEVLAVRVDEGLRLRDLRTSEELQVSERSATHQIQRWDVLAARVAPDGEGALRLEGGIYLLPVASKAPLLEAVEAEERRLRRGDPGLDDDTLWRRCAPLVHHYWLDHVVARPIIRQYKDRHYKTWPDTPLPGLDGRTPRESAGLPALRPRLVDLLKDMENMEERGARPGSPAYDFGWIWTELGLERPR